MFPSYFAFLVEVTWWHRLIYVDRPGRPKFPFRRKEICHIVVGQTSVPVLETGLEGTVGLRHGGGGTWQSIKEAAVSLRKDWAAALIALTYSEFFPRHCFWM